MKSTALAYSNIAFIKYWGKYDSNLRLPLNGSISMNLSALQTVTTVEFSTEYKTDEIIIDNQKNPNTSERIIRHLNKIRKLGESSLFAKIFSLNNFPASTGLSSSASGFAALTLAASNALGLNNSQKDLSILSRLGSGSASRSIPGGYVEWLKGTDSNSSYSYSIFPENHWDIVDLVAIVSTEKKQTSTSDAQKFVLTSPFLKTRLANIDKKINALKSAISNKNFTTFGEIIESETLEFHSIVMTQNPSFLYLLPTSLNLMQEVRQWRKDGLEVYFTINTGHNIHLVCKQKDKEKLQQKLKEIAFVKNIIINTPAGPAKIINNHLF